jgi:hypothetical protein
VAFVHWLLPPHWLGVPPPPQTAGDVQLPHARTPPHPSAMGPHALAGHVRSGWHGVPPSPRIVPPPHTLALPPPPQIAGAVHPLPLPQFTTPPQPSAMLPQFIPAGHDVILLHTGVPHWFG